MSLSDDMNRKVKAAVTHFMCNVIADNTQRVNNQDPAMLELVMAQKFADEAKAYFDSLSRKAIADGLLPDISKKRCTSDTVLYDSDLCKVNVMVGIPRSQFNKAKCLNSLELDGVKQDVIDRAVDKATVKTAAPQFVHYIVKG